MRGARGSASEGVRDQYVGASGSSATLRPCSGQAPQVAFFNGRTVSGGDSGGVTPDPIPNSAVKPSSADGTIGSPYGRVGRRRIYSKAPTLKKVGAFFWCRMKTHYSYAGSLQLNKTRLTERSVFASQ